MLVSCGGTKELSNNEEVVQTDESDSVKSQRNVKIKAIIGDFKDSDSYDIKSVNIEANTMFLEITYLGGCADHQFELIGRSMIIKTFPPKRFIKLIHNNGEDSCSSIVNRTIEIDIKDLAFNQTPKAEIHLVLDGWEEKIKYIYQ